MTPEKRFARLWTDYLEGDLDEAGLAELRALLSGDESLQACAVELFQTHRLLGYAMQETNETAEAFVRSTLAQLPKTDDAFVDSVLNRVRPAANSRGTANAGRLARLMARPVAALAAGVMLGVLGTSVLWAYAIADGVKAWMLLDEGFESGPAPLVTGVPSKPDVWSGDYSEVVGEQQGVTPAGGKRMLRFLRADYQGKRRDEGYIGEVYRLVDLRPWQAEIADGGAVVELSASFSAGSFPSEERYLYGLILCALDHDLSVSPPAPTAMLLLDQSLAASRRSGEATSHRPSEWQKLTTELRVPPKTRFLMVRLSVERMPPHSRLPAVRFSGHYVDDVRITLARRTPRP